jgi:hypothetical protein
VLRPHHAEQAEFGEGGWAAEDGEARAVLVRLEAELGGELRGAVFGQKRGAGGGLVGVGHGRFLGGAPGGSKRGGLRTNGRALAALTSGTSPHGGCGGAAARRERVEGVAQGAGGEVAKPRAWTTWGAGMVGRL